MRQIFTYDLELTSLEYRHITDTYIQVYEEELELSTLYAYWLKDFIDEILSLSDLTIYRRRIWRVIKRKAQLVPNADLILIREPQE